jgi:hypothetical protein
VPKQPKTREQAPFKGFIEYDLTVQEKAQLKSASFDLVDANVQMENLVRDEYRVSFGFDFYNGTFTCSLSHKDPKHANAGWVLVGRGSEPIKALKQVLFKHHTVFDGQWSNARAMSRDELDD